MSEMENIQHPTSNIQHPTRRASSLHWMLDIGCWVLDVFPSPIGGVR
jgi:hypothetical protein